MKDDNKAAHITAKVSIIALLALATVRRLVGSTASINGVCDCENYLPATCFLKATLDTTLIWGKKGGDLIV